MALRSELSISTEFRGGGESFFQIEYFKITRDGIKQ